MIDEDIFDIEQERRYHTMAGFVMHILERIPQEADSFEWRGYRFEVIDMDGKRIDKLLINQLEPASSNDVNNSSLKPD